MEETEARSASPDSSNGSYVESPPDTVTTRFEIPVLRTKAGTVRPLGKHLSSVTQVASFLDE